MSLAPPGGGPWRTVRWLPVGPGVMAEVVHAGAPAAHGVLWPLALPARPATPGLPSVARGRRGGQPATLEPLPPGALLDELHLPPDHAAWLEVAAALTPIVAALHAAGRAHGAVRADRVWVDRDGGISLVGAGAVDGTPSDDEAALAALYSQHADRGETLPRSGRGDLSARVRARLRGDDPRALDEPTDAVPSSAHEPTPPAGHPPAETTGEAGRLDEVGAELGVDRVRGLLDRTGESTGWSDRTLPGEPTGVLTSAGQAAHPRLAALARLLDGGVPAVDPGRLGGALPRARAELEALWAHEPSPLPPLPDAGPRPVPPWRRIAAPGGEDTAIRRDPTRPAPVVPAPSPPEASTPARPSQVPSQVPPPAAAEPPAAEPPAAEAPAAEPTAARAAVIFLAGVLLTLAVGLAVLAALPAR